MYAAVTLILLICLSATSHADHHHVPCQSPNMTGFMNVMVMQGEPKAMGPFTYDSTGNRLRFTSSEIVIANITLPHMDLLVLFEEGVLYEIDSKNQSCKKKAMQSTTHPLQVPKDATLITPMNLGNPSIEGEGLTINIWIGSQAQFKGYSMSVTKGCLPVSSMYFSESTLFFSLADVENEVKDPDLLAVPSYCQGLAVKDTVKSFLHEFV